MERMIKNDYTAKDNIEKVEKAEVEKKMRHLGQIKMIRGLTLWEVNYVEGTVVPAVYEVVKNRAYDVTKENIKQSTNKKIVSKKDCIYIQALNLRVAIKKANKVLFELFGY